MGNNSSCSKCLKKLDKFQRGGHVCIICNRPHCTNCSNREALKTSDGKKKQRKRICHACVITFEQNGKEFVIKRQRSQDFSELDKQNNSLTESSWKNTKLKKKSQMYGKDQLSQSMVLVGLEKGKTVIDELRISKPKGVEQLVSISYNDNTSQYEGLPTEWRELMGIQPQQKEVKKIDSQLHIRRGTFTPLRGLTNVKKPKFVYNVEATEGLGQYKVTMKGFKRPTIKQQSDEESKLTSSSSEVSTQSPMDKVYFVNVDNNADSGFNGLPQELEDQLMSMNFERQLIQQNPEQVLQVLQFQNQRYLEKEEQEIPLPRNLEVARLMRNQSLFKQDNPAEYYDIIAQIGVGAYGKIFEVS
ncbi:p21-activated protein kinase [Stylonychia lemnae]|uniref:p21-activated protein kinase n=1 Tax=Stylonychia lemnae TaxID=5949 RepID=A0A078BB42_STYLE|nr:p21-activated protein kinase [Stylonychia lemnae]|eukprot:CDW90783.1 p21-activated protein kinase [Stylonychia lemnae]